MFVNRQKEKDRLTKAFHKTNPQLIIVYGRRRCGKSALLRNVLPKGSIYFSADLRESRLQINAFANQVNQVVDDFNRVIYPDWESVLLSLNRSVTGITTVCVDEFPYLVRNSPELPSVIQKLTDNKSLNKIHLVLCGSSQQMMQGMVMDSASPLYGRCNEVLRIDPMPAFYLSEFLGLLPVDTVTEYAVWGGVPRYWEVRATSPDFKEAIKYHVLDKNGILNEEPERLFLDEMRTSMQAYSVIALIAGGCHRLSEIAARLNKPATQLSRILQFLVDLKYIDRELPYGESWKNSKKSLYKVRDPFLDFYFRFLVPNKSMLEFGMIDQVWENIHTQLDQYVSFHWEELCRKAVPMLTISGKKYMPASRWWGNLNGQNTEIDIMADSIDKTTVLIGEVKWSEKVNHQEIRDQLQKKTHTIPGLKGKKIQWVCFVKDKKGIESDWIFDASVVINVLR
jgi:uncharacterized protein